MSARLYFVGDPSTVEYQTVDGSFVFCRYEFLLSTESRRDFLEGGGLVSNKRKFRDAVNCAELVTILGRKCNRMATAPAAGMHCDGSFGGR
jgi:hypothetical protein